jgi:tetratricopeptide (TPR) repeat protein
MKRILISILVLSALSALPVFAQSFRSLNNDGVDQYLEKKYGDAEIKFRKGIEKEPGKYKGYFNLGDNYYKQGKYDEAVKSYKNAMGKTRSNTEKADAYHNIGNALLKKGDYQESIGAFKNSLKLNPKDKETKYNLSYALNMLKNQQNKNQNNKDKNQDKNKDNQDKNQNKNDQNKNNDKNKNDQNKNDQDKKNNDQQQQQPQQSPPKVKKDEAERMLEALKNNEQDLQKKLRKKAAVKVKTDKDW